METAKLLNITGLCANILGTIVLAYSISGYLKSIHLAIEAHELFMVSTTNRKSDIYAVTGTPVHMARDRKKSNLFTIIGIILVIMGFGAQLLSYMK